MDKIEFEALLKKAENQWLDWKEDFPPGLLKGSRSPDWERGKADLLKDLVSLANSAGQTPAYLVYGVQDLRFRRNVKGISKSFEGANFEQWSKNTFEPSPKFQYAPLEWSPSQIIGIFQIDKTADYPYVVKNTIGNMLHKGQVWFRTGSQNAVALRSDLEKMFRGEEPIMYPNLHDPKLEMPKKFYKTLGREYEFVRVYEKRGFLQEGYEEALYPGTRQGIVIGGPNPELVMLLKPKIEK